MSLCASTLAQTVDHMIRRIALSQKIMPGLRAEMRDIHDGRWIAGQQTQNSPLRQGGKGLARLQHRQWAQQTNRVDLGLGDVVMSHIGDIEGASQTVHNDVTKRHVTLGP